MIALDAKTGKPVPSFGTDGRIDLTQGLRRPVDRGYYTMTSPPVIVRGVIVVGSSVMDWWAKKPSPPGDVRGFDAGSGRLLWTFHTIAQGRGARRRQLAEGFVEGRRQRQCLGADERGRGAGIRLFTGEHADQ
jgi:glucose dehydrogenase